MSKTRVIVIGGGVAGYPAALRAARLGAEVSLIEKNKIGGVCLNRGCIPTKVYLHAASLLRETKKASLFGVNAEKVEFDFKSLLKQKKAVVDRLTGGVSALLSSKKVRFVNGTAALIDAKRVKILETGEVLTGDKLILASGSVPASLSAVGGKDVSLLTSDDLLQMESLPKSLLIIGGGYIGVELGQFFSRTGAKVSIVEMADRIIPNEDEEVSSALRGFLEEEGIDIYTRANVEKIDKEGSGKKVTFSTPEGQKALKVSEVAQTVGRRPYSSDLGIERIGLETEKGRIVVNDRMETNIPHIYAAGDLIGGTMLAHAAMAEGECAARNALGQASSVSYRSVPRCIYTSPEVACVGLTEKQAHERGEIQVSRFPFRAIGKASLMDEGVGMIKMVAGKKYGEVLGVHMIGPHVTELVAEAVLSIDMEITVEELAHTVHPHPTLSEALGETAMHLSGGALHLP